MVSAWRFEWPSKDSSSIIGNAVEFSCSSKGSWHICVQFLTAHPLHQSFRDAEQWEDAHACVDEMRRLYPRLPQSMYERGRMLECEMKRAMKAGDISTMEELRAQALECYHRVLTDDSR